MTLPCTQSALYEQVRVELNERQRVEGELSRLFNLSLDLVYVAGIDGQRWIEVRLRSIAA